jgi:WhiB family redox-sensing transcriptional regulator
MAKLMGMPVATTSLPLDDLRARAKKGSIIELRSQLKAPLLLIGPGLPCQQEDPGLWFSSVPAELNLAKAYCRGCRNRQPCLDGALERGEPTGVWGGEIFEQGRIIAFKRPRGRPRKSTQRDDQR